MPAGHANSDPGLNDPTGPVTKAGRALLRRTLFNFDGIEQSEGTKAEWVLAIEAEAAARALSTASEKVAGLATINPWEGMKQDFAGPAAVGYDAAIRDLLSLLAGKESRT